MVEKKRRIYSGMQILIDQRWVKDQAVVVENHLIKGIIPKAMIKHHLPAMHIKYPEDHFLAPGLIDLHVHGAKGKDVMDGDQAAFDTISAALAEEGVTAFLATTMTANDAKIASVLSAIPEAMNSKTGAAILGVHLEGPFIAKSKAGAQVGDLAKMPDLQLMEHWQEISGNAVKLVTLAPELNDTLPLIETLRNMGVIVSVGHTNATYAETQAAIKAGCNYATHLFNAMRGLQQREPGAASALLMSDMVTAELIVDGAHLHPAIVELALRVKGRDRLVLVTDAMRAKCCGDGEYELGGQVVTVHDGKANLSDGTLAGSTLRMPQAIKNMIEFTSCSSADAFHMATSVPAKVLGLAERKGKIDVGMDADLIVMNAQYEVVLTIRRGKTIFRRTET